MPAGGWTRWSAMEAGLSGLFTSRVRAAPARLLWTTFSASTGCVPGSDTHSGGPHLTRARRMELQ